jgi:ribonuclease P protein component
MKNPCSLKNTRQFSACYKRGKRSYSQYFTVFVLANGSDEVRLGVSVSKKIGNSVVRHRIARLARESVRTLKSDIPYGTDMVLVAKDGAAAATFGDTCSAITMAIRKTGDKIMDRG